MNDSANNGSSAPDVEGSSPLEDSLRMHDRDERLAHGAEQLETAGEGTIWANPRILLIVAATLMSVGLTLILLGYVGAARTTLMEEQIPYLISGGILGLALSLLGGLSLFGHWQTAHLREARAHAAQLRQDNAAILEELRGLRADLGSVNSDQAWEVPGDADARSTRDTRPLRPDAGR